MDTEQTDFLSELDLSNGNVHKTRQTPTNKKILEMADTEVSYVGGAETIVEFESIDVDEKRFHINPDTRRKWFFTYGVCLRVAKYKGKLFFGNTIYFWDGFSSIHIKVERDFDLEKNFKERGEKPPEHTYRTSPSVEVVNGNDAILQFATEYLKHETRCYNMQKFIDETIRLFKEALS